MLVTLSILRNFIISWKIIRIVFNRLKRAISARRNTKFVRKNEVETKIFRIDLDSRFLDYSFATKLDACYFVDPLEFYY